ncbi:helix-turn-helix transcriptional regulator [Cohnella sp. AR92]|uniref:helix-turn-helix domain-containing protein n=1 Tax=Cohnella sp. AR92 TaxID=648716 RepID=UPI000F8E51E9|nr:helix-turn-helix transcriptional regulator [Cohnella sp. AR92]RUS48387.1 XRE family transcriptional regulator [Cohnella sp. AR92]
MIRLKLCAVMGTKGLNARQLSEATGIRWNTIDDMMKNKSKAWSVENLNKIAKELGITDASELIEYKEEEQEG